LRKKVSHGSGVLYKRKREKMCKIEEEEDLEMIERIGACG